MRHDVFSRLLLLTLAFGGALAPPVLAASNDRPSSLSQLIRSEADGKYARFYQSRGYRTLWFTGGKANPAASALMSQISSARVDGLDPDDYDREGLRRALADARSGDPRAIARAEVAMSQAFVDLVTDMREPERVGMTYLSKSVKPRKRGTEAVLRAAMIAPSFAGYVTSIGWMSPHYVRQRKMMARAMSGKSSEATLSRLRLNMERARILPSAWTHHIVVDSASGKLWYYQAGAQKGTMRVVVGKPESPTPMYAGVVQYAVLRPYWNVPVDLTQKLIAPKVLAGKSLSSMGYEALSDWGANPRKLAASEIDWRSVARGDQELRVRQLPGPTNSMGRVKFMFPNQTGIFLHDTPDRKLFAKASRHFSNGCVRLEDAPGLGKWLMGRALPTKTVRPDQAVSLSAPVPIYMTYFTSTEGKAGVIFLKDVYQRDRAAKRFAARDE
jgi:L,D-transpeptidase YcbB